MAHVCLVIILALAVTSHAVDIKTSCVFQEERNCSKTNTGSIACHTLQEYADNSSEYFVSNSVFLFLPGEHVLTHGTTVSISNASNVTLTSNQGKFNECDCCFIHQEVTYTNPKPIINCSNFEVSFEVTNVTNFDIKQLEFTRCGKPLRNVYSYKAVGGTLIMKNVINLKMEDVTITEGIGYGVLGYGVLGHTSVTNCIFSGNGGRWIRNNTLLMLGGNMELHYNQSCVTNSSKSSLFNIESSKFLYGRSTANFASGLNLIHTCTSGGIHFILNNVNFSNNIGNDSSFGGANFASEMLAISNNLSSISFNNCIISNGNSFLGSGLFFVVFRNISVHQYTLHNENKNTFIIIENTNFENNTAEAVGAGLYIRLHYSAQVQNISLPIILKNCSFVRNKLRAVTQRRGGVAVNIVTFLIQAYHPHVSPQYSTVFDKCTFEEQSQEIHPTAEDFGGSTIYIENLLDVIFKNCRVRNNACTGIAAVYSYLQFRENNWITNNMARDGAGLHLNDDSVIAVNAQTHLTISYNNASNKGGGIYAESYYGSGTPFCFFQLNDKALFNNTLQRKIRIELSNNTASIAGTVLYGGEIDHCYFLTPNKPGNSRKLEHLSSKDVFDRIFHYQNGTKVPAVISSDPIQVCLCRNKIIHCNENVHKTISPGQSFSVAAVVVGQRQGVVPGSVVGHISTTQNAQIKELERIQNTNNTCTYLTYTIMSTEENLAVNLSLSVPGYHNTASDLLINIHLSRCPVGFTLDNQSSMCTCADILKNNRLNNCNAINNTIQRPSNYWIGCRLPNNTLHNNWCKTKYLFVTEYCPYLYCKPSKSLVKAGLDTLQQDDQCYNNRSGTLCGRCRGNLSMVFGSSQCVDCRHTNIWKTVLYLGLFAFAGIALILILLVLGSHLTVAAGTINGIIFCANIIETYKNIYFPFNMNECVPCTVLGIFFSLLNLDLGYPVCFYDRMTTYVKIWIEFIFPLYIFMLAGLLIWLSRKYTFVARKLQNNGTKILGTLVLLSYTKMIQIIVICFSRAKLVGKYEQHFVWRADGNLLFYKEKHIYLFLFAIVMSLLILPFTLILFFIRTLQKRSHKRLYKWVSRIKPFLDVYTGIYTVKFQCWTGLLLMIRILLVAVVEALEFSNTLPLLLVAATCCILLMTPWFFHSTLYTNKYLDSLDAWLMVNLIGWSLVISYGEYKNKTTNKKVAVLVFGGLFFLTFCAILLYCLHKQMSQMQCWKRALEKFKQRMRSISLKLRIRRVTRYVTHNSVYIESEGEEVSLLANAPPVARYDGLRESLLESRSD